MYYAEGYGASCFQGMTCGGRLVQDEFRWLTLSHTARSIKNRLKQISAQMPKLARLEYSFLYAMAELLYLLVSEAALFH